MSKDSERDSETLLMHGTLVRDAAVNDIVPEFPSIIMLTYTQLLASARARNISLHGNVSC